MKARIRLQKDCIISPIDPRVFGSFIEHLGRAVYTGIYEPGHPTADAFGFRGDVEELIRPLHVTQIRYPGGNFLSGYDWRDGIGPKDRRPVRPDMAWSAIEPNQVGTDEFLQWCERIGAQPMMAVNLGTGTPKDAVELLEYCNGDMHTYWADKRRENGREAPYNVKLWCLGNEMDGPWQICSKTATEYGRIACETAKLMKMFDPTIETVACGSSYRTMPTFGTWEEEVLRQSYPYVDYLSLHQYYTNHEGDVMNFLARSEVWASSFRRSPPSAKRSALRSAATSISVCRSTSGTSGITMPRTARCRRSGRSPAPLKRRTTTLQTLCSSAACSTPCSTTPTS